MPDTHMTPERRPPEFLLLFTAIGRQQTGKTTLLNALIQWHVKRHHKIAILNADQKNTTRSLSTFFPAAQAAPADGSLVDNRVWIEGAIHAMVRGRYHAALDVGGGFTGFTALAETVPLHEALAVRGVKLVGLMCVGTEQADLDYLSRHMDSGAFNPASGIIVSNAGLITSGRSPSGAFATVTAHPAVRQAVGAGAKLLFMPALGCMAEVTDRGVSFADAAMARVREGQEPMSMFDPSRVNRSCASGWCWRARRRSS